MPFPITCTACGKAFSIADDIYERKVKGRIVTIKCKQCLAGIRVDDTQGESGSGQAVGSSPVADEQAADEPTRIAMVAPSRVVASATSKVASKPKSDAADPSATEKPLASPSNAMKPGAPRPQPLAAAIGLKARPVAALARTPPSAAATKGSQPGTMTKTPAADALGAVEIPPAAQRKVEPLMTGATLARAAEPPAVPVRIDESTAVSEAVTEETLWAVDYPDGQDRELTARQIALERAAGAIDDLTLVWREGMSEWKELREMRELLAPSAQSAPAAPFAPIASPILGALAQRSIALTVPQLDLPVPEATPETPQAARAGSSPRAAQGPAPRAASPSAPRAASGLLGPPAPRLRAPSSPGPIEPKAPRVASPSSPHAAPPLGSKPGSQSAPAWAEPPTALPGLEPSRPFATFTAPKAPVPAMPSALGATPGPAAAPFAAGPPRAVSFAPLVSTNAAEPLFSIPPPSVAVPTRATVTADEWPRSRRRGPLVIGLLGLLVAAGCAIFYLRGPTLEAAPPAAPISALPPAPTPLTQGIVPPATAADSGSVVDSAAAGRAASPGLLEAPGTTPTATPNAGFAELFASGAKKADEKHGVGGPAQHFDAGLAKTALAAVAGQTASCREKGGPAGRATIVVTFAPTGKVASASLSDAPFAGTSSGACIAAIMKRATIPPFSGLPGTVIKVVSVY